MFLECLPGHERNKADSRCYPCPIGTFTHPTWRKLCFQCSYRKTTEAEGSSSRDACSKLENLVHNVVDDS